MKCLIESIRVCSDVKDRLLLEKDMTNVTVHGYWETSFFQSNKLTEFVQKRIHWNGNIGNFLNFKVWRKWNGYTGIKLVKIIENLILKLSSSYSKFRICHICSSPDQKIVGNSLQPIGGLITGNCIYQGFRRKVTVDVIGQIGNIQFPRILWYEKLHLMIDNTCVNTLNICLNTMNSHDTKRMHFSSCNYYKILKCIKFRKPSGRNAIEWK